MKSTATIINEVMSRAKNTQEKKKRSSLKRNILYMFGIMVCLCVMILSICQVKTINRREYPVTYGAMFHINDSIDIYVVISVFTFILGVVVAIACVKISAYLKHE